MSWFFPKAKQEAAVREAFVATLGQVDEFWSQNFVRRGWPFQSISLVFYSGSIQTKSGVVSNDKAGPAYSPLDRALFLDPSFFLGKGAGAKIWGPITPILLAYISAHEYGHHLQKILESGSRSQQLSSTPQDFSLKNERQADCLAGVYIHHLVANGEMTQVEALQVVNIIRASSVEEQLERVSGQMSCAQLLQTRLLIRESDGHGSSELRSEWFMRGLNSGDLSQCEPFAVPVLNPMQ